jgi:REP element-mobilizing transposase RayT
MAVKTQHQSSFAMFYCTFTCFKWLNLFEITQAYDSVYKWFYYLRDKKQIEVVAYVIMPNHVHFILYFPNEDFNLNMIIGNAKRFLAYEIVKRLKGSRSKLLRTLTLQVTGREAQKGQKHRVFENSFDAKPIFTEKFFHQKLDYIHANPVSGKWSLVNDICSYPHSSASYYLTGKYYLFKPLHFANVF